MQVPCLSIGFDMDSRNMVDMCRSPGFSPEVAVISSFPKVPEGK